MKKYCQNCYHPLPYKAKFCAHCGQKVSDGKVTMGDILQQLWFRILHLESRSWRVLWRLFVPGQVSIDYFSGKRKRYPPPVQFFFIIMFFFLLLVNYIAGNSAGFGFRQTKSGIQYGTSNDSSATKLDVYEVGKAYVRSKRLKDQIDSLPLDSMPPQVRAALDSILRQSKQTEQILGRVFSTSPDSILQQPPDSATINIGFRQLKIATTDLFEKDVETLIVQYQLDHWIDKATLRQGVKSIKDPNALVKTYLGSLAWTMLALIVLMAGVMTLLYRRRGRYYVEHFIFLLHQHTAAFLILTLLLLLHQLFALPALFWAFVFFALVASMLIAMRRYYGQGWGKTTLKWFIFSIIYFVGLNALFILSIMLAFFIF